MSFSKVGVVGTGVIGEALIGSLLRFGIPKDSILISEKRDERKGEILQKYGVAMLESIEYIVTISHPLPLIVSFAAGIKIGAIEKILGNKARVVRVMPNTPMTLGRGMSAMSLGAHVTKDDQDWVSRFLKTMGEVIEVSEDLQDAVTATSGSGPAYYFAFTEAVVAAATQLGLSEADAITLARETLIGAALMVEKSGKDLQTLRENVTSPNGTTAAALKSFKDSGLQDLVLAAMKAARDRSIELSS
jgi:pyrroline-5-carboxylate reductase